MDFVQPKEDDSASILLPPVTPAEVSVTFGGLPTSPELPKKTKSMDDPETQVEASNLSKHNYVKTRSPGGETEQSTGPRKEDEADESVQHRTSGRITKKFGKPSRVRKFPFGQYSSKASNSILSASFRHKALSKASKLGPITCRGALRIAGELRKNHLKARSDLFSDGEALLHVIAAAHPRYDRMIRALPTAVNLVPGELKEKLMNEKTLDLLKIGVFLANEWISRPA
jgi:hypothetical protein